MSNQHTHIPHGRTIVSHQQQQPTSQFHHRPATSSDTQLGVSRLEQTNFPPSSRMSIPQTDETLSSMMEELNTMPAGQNTSIAVPVAQREFQTHQQQQNTVDVARRQQTMDAYNAYLDSVRASRHQAAMFEAATYSSSLTSSITTQSQIPRNRNTVSVINQLALSSTPPPLQQHQPRGSSATSSSSSSGGSENHRQQQIMNTRLTSSMFEGNNPQQYLQQQQHMNLGGSSRTSSSIYQFLRGQQQLYQVQRGGGGGGTSGVNARAANSNISSGRHPFMSKTVCELSCKHCTTTICRRGMKAILLADTAVELFSTDNPPMGAQLVNDDYTTASCACRIRDVACLSCGCVVGYHVTQPCDVCLSSCNNGHFWMFHCTEVSSCDRLGQGNKQMLWAHLPRVDLDVEGSEQRNEIVCR